MVCRTEYCRYRNEIKLNGVDCMLSSKKNFIYRMVSLILVFTLCISLSVVSYAADKTLNVSYVKGTVTVFKSGGSKEFSAYKNMKLKKGDKIKTGVNSTATLVLDDREMIVGSNAVVVVDKATGSGKVETLALSIIEGSVKNKVSSPLTTNSTNTIKTTNTVAGVRGTEFVTSYSKDQQTKIVTFEGNVKMDFIEPDGNKQDTNVYVNRDGVVGVPPQNFDLPMNLKDMDVGILDSLAENLAIIQSHPDFFKGIEVVLEAKHQEAEKMVIEAKHMQETKENLPPPKYDSKPQDAPQPSAPPTNDRDTSEHTPAPIPTSTTITDPTPTPVATPIPTESPTDIEVDWESGNNSHGGGTIKGTMLATDLEYGQTLSESELSGTLVQRLTGWGFFDGTFSWKTPSKVPESGNELQTVKFTPRWSWFMKSFSVDIRVLVSPRAIEVTGLTALNKSLDGTNCATIATGSAVFDRVATGDSLYIATCEAFFDDSNAGTNKPVSFSSITLGGERASNYALNTPSGLTANIFTTPAARCEKLVIDNIRHTATFEISFAKPHNLLSDFTISEDLAPYGVSAYPHHCVSDTTTGGTILTIELTLDSTKDEFYGDYIISDGHESFWFSVAELLATN